MIDDLRQLSRPLKLNQECNLSNRKPADLWFRFHELVVSGAKTICMSGWYATKDTYYMTSRNIVWKVVRWCQ